MVSDQLTILFQGESFEGGHEGVPDHLQQQREGSGEKNNVTGPSLPPLDMHSLVSLDENLLKLMVE